MLYSKLVGNVGISPLEFYGLTLKQAKLILNGYEEKAKQDYHYTFMACYNAFGVIQVGKNFKIIDPFDEQKESGYRKSTIEERKETLSYLFDKFKK